MKDPVMILRSSRIATSLNVFALATMTVILFAGAQNDAEKRFSDATMDLGIVVSDLGASVRFYTEVVGLEKTGGFSVGSRTGDHRFIHSQLGYSYLTFYVADIEAASARMKAAGIKAAGREQVRVPLETPVPMFLTLIADPDGNLIELIGPKAKQ